jgi:hypothetical protein
MAHRAEEKQRRRLERLAKEEEARRRERARWRRRIAAALVVLAITGGALGLWRPWETDTDPASAFSYDADGVQERIERAGLKEGSDPHVHPKLNVIVRERAIPLAPNMGIGAVHTPLHTHEADGVIHVEGAQDATLGQFMALWGVDFGRDRLGPYRAQGPNGLRMWVKAPKAKAFEERPPDPSLRLEDRQEIYLFYGPPSQAPIA